MVALEAGWTPDMLAAGMPDRFRRAAHWVVYVRALIGEGLSIPPVPEGAPPTQRIAFAKASVKADEIRRHIFPEGDDDGDA